MNVKEEKSHANRDSKRAAFNKMRYGTVATEDLSSAQWVFYKTRLDLLPSRTWQSVLEIGCGRGELLKCVQASRRVGVDLTTEPLKHLQALGIETYVCDVTQRLPFSDASFDLLICSEVIEHVFDTDALLQECYRCLQPGGLLLVTTPNVNNWRNRILVPLGFYPILLEHRPIYGHIRAYNAQRLREQLTSCGFRDVRIRGLNLLPMKLLARFPWLFPFNRLLARWAGSLSACIGATARR